MDHHLKVKTTAGLERLCNTTRSEHMFSTEPILGIEILQAWFAGDAYDNHRHDTYAIGITDSGLQSYDYRGATQTSTPGSVMVLHPDELHNGRAGSTEGFGYRMLYVDPALISDAVRSVSGRPSALPFARESVSNNPLLSSAVQIASLGALQNSESLASDEILLLLAKGLIAADSSCINPRHKYSIDYRAVDLAREYLNAQEPRVVHSAELEKVTGLSRYDLCRQFKKVLGTSPYRYSVNRRLDMARRLIQQGHPLIELAFATGFADQAHFSRLFKAAFGMPPKKYAALKVHQYKL